MEEDNPATRSNMLLLGEDERPEKLLHEIHRRDATSSTAFDKVIRTTTTIQAQEFRIWVYYLVEGRRRKTQVHEVPASKL